MRKESEKPYYGFKKVISIDISLTVCGVIVTSLAIAFTVLAYSTWQLALCWFFGVMLLIAAVLWHSMTFVAYPKKARALEESLLDILRSDWDGKGRVLDIGTGSGRLAVPIAREFPQAQVIGVDIWTKSWDSFGQTQARAEKNAMIAGVDDRCTFQYGNALSLPFKDGEFSLVVSAFAFHEIKAPDKTALVDEAIRVLAPAGTFLICDLFPRGYVVKNVPELLEKIQGLGVDDVRHKSMKEAGVNLGPLARIWGISYLSGRKSQNQS